MSLTSKYFSYKKKKGKVNKEKNTRNQCCNCLQETQEPETNVFTKKNEKCKVASCNCPCNIVVVYKAIKYQAFVKEPENEENQTRNIKN